MVERTLLEGIGAAQPGTDQAIERDVSARCRPPLRADAPASAAILRSLDSTPKRRGPARDFIDSQSCAVGRDGSDGQVIAQFGPRALQREFAASLGNTEAFFGNATDLEPNSSDVAVAALNMTT